MSIEDTLNSQQRTAGSATMARHSRLFQQLAIAGALVLAIGIFFAPIRVWSNLLVLTFYLLTVALGGALFLAFTQRR